MPSVVNGHADSEVVLTGLSGRMPESENIDEFARNLFEGVDMVTDDDRRWTPEFQGLPSRMGKLKNLKHFDAGYFNLFEKQADVMDPGMRILFEVTHETIVDAGYNPTELRGTRTGVYVGVGRFETYEAFGTLYNKCNGYTMIGGIGVMFPNRVSYAFDLKGPSLAIDVACSSSTYALAQAVNDIKVGHCDAAIVAGVNICLDPSTSLNFLNLNMLSKNGRCASFDESGQGYVRSEAVVAVLLQRRNVARRVYCTVHAARVNNDGHKPQGLTYPSGEMQGRIAKETYDETGLRPQDVTYFEAHGTGTKAGDPQELNAIVEQFCKNRGAPLLMGSVKSNMGHAEWASGLCSIAKVVLAMERGVIPGNLHYKNPNTDIPALSDGRIQVVDKNTSWQGGVVSVNSSGFGGANAHVILEGGCGNRPPPAQYATPRLILASGRTDKAVEKLLKLASESPQDGELHALIDTVHAHAIPNHPRRGYAILRVDAAPIIEVMDSESEHRPIWFACSGMGSQWAGMARELLRLPVFASSIERSAAALKPYMDLKYVISEASPEEFGNLINCVVSIVAVQVALVDVLSELGVHPDGIIGHSLGETGCGYIDRTLTSEQTVLAAYWRARCTIEAKLPIGAMAAVGLSWEETAKRCPENIDIACHNGPESVTISGPKAAVEKFAKQLAVDDVFVRMVDSSNVAFHSRSVASVAPQLRKRLQEIIPHPKPRSPRWLSSSIPQDKWDSDLARCSGADYIVNNQLSPVRFADVLSLIPPRALLIEIGPHALLQAVLKRALPEAIHVPLVRKDAPDALIHLLAAVGKIYAAGAQPQVARLYPPVSWPVSRGTPGLASHISWDHSIEWTVVNPTTAARTSENIFEYDLTKPEEEFIAGHNIEGRVLFPATGYLTLVWRTVAKMNNQDIEQSAVILENVNIYRATIMSREAPVRFLVSLLDGTGEFQISEGGEVVVTGTARITANASAERLSANALAEAEEHVSQELSLKPEDIYKDLSLRGYKYKGIFRGIKSSDACGLKGLLNWEGNWISFMDTALQFGLIGMDTRDLYLPARIERVVIDPAAQRKEAALATNGALPVKRYPSIGVIVAGGVEFRGLITTLAPRRINIQAPPKLEKFVFLPFNSVFEDKRQALTAAVQLVIENFGVQQFNIVEAALKRPVEELLLPHAVQDFQGEPAVRVSATLAAGTEAPHYSTVMNSLGVRVSDREVSDCQLDKKCHLVMGADVLSQPEVLSALAAASVGFLLLEEKMDLFDKCDKAMVENGLSLVSRSRTGSREYILLRRSTTLPSTRIIVEARDDDFTWVNQLKDAMYRVQTEDLRVYVWSRDHGSGVLGLGTCLRREPGGDKLRFYYLPGGHSLDLHLFKDQVEKDLTFNVLKGGVWGTFRHLLLDDVSSARKQVEHAYVDAITRGDLSSLRWIESDLCHAAFTPRCPHTDLSTVYYASLNFRDVMNATGKLSSMATIGTLAKLENSIIGLEFSGLSSSRKRVMGIVTRGLATSVMADTGFLWEVPNHWSLEEAASVPIAYGTAYYALVVRGHMRRGEAVLIHAGAGGVGQAAITVALNAGCTVFTTVGSPAKRAFLRERFPQLQNANIGNSRDCSFEQLVQRRTQGRGVDLVLNSLAGDQLQASLRCLGERGRFLEIGKVDLIANSALGLSFLLKNTSVQGILLDALFPLPADDPEKMEVVRSVAEGIAAGVVRPLPTTAYGEDQLEQAFRYMATGKHIGKVLIRVRDEETNVEQSSRLIPALPRTYMHPGKSYVLVGGLGGFGLELGNWLVRRGARTLVFNSRNGVQTGYQALCIRRWSSSGVHILLSSKDATTAAGARALLEEAAALAPVGGIFNLAAVLRDAFFENQTPEAFQTVAKPKIGATRVLDKASRELAPELEHFVVFSSVSCGRGNVGQTNYGLANSAMERLCEQRRADQLPGLAVQWGAVGDVGLVAAMAEDAVVGGTAPQRIESCLQTLDVLLGLPHAVVASMVLADEQTPQDKPAQDLAQAVANVLGIKDVKKVSETATLVELGIDSLMGAEIKQTLERSYDVVLSAQEVRDLTFAKLRSMTGDAPTTS